MFPSLATVQISTLPPHPTKSTVTIAVVRKFFIAGKLSPHRVSLSSRFNHAQEAEHHRAFPKNPTGLDALWYESGAMQNIPVPTQNGFLDKRPSVHLTEREKKQGLKTRTEVVTVCGPAGCAVSSVGRALPRHGRGHWFKSSTAHHLLNFTLFLHSRISLHGSHSRQFGKNG